MRYLVLAAALFQSVSASALAPASVSPPPGLEAKLDALFARWASGDRPGCVVGVEQAGRGLVLKSYGKANLELDVPLTPGSVLNIASVSKQFTAAAVLILAEDERLSLQDDVRKYVPELPDHGAPITLAHLLHHTSGLRDWGALAAIGGWPRERRSHNHNDVLDILARQRSLNNAPGDEFLYTNSGYNLLAMVVERVSGQTLQAFSQERLFAPLGMTHTQWGDDFTRLVPGRANAYGLERDRYPMTMQFEDVYGNGNLLSTVGDLLTWNRALDEGRFGSFVGRELERAGVLNDGRRIGYGAGLYLDTYGGLREVAHSGIAGGYRSWLGRYPDRKLSIALLCNTLEADQNKLAHQIADLFIKRPDISPSSVPKIDLASRTGLYRDIRSGQSLRLTLDQGRPRLSKGGELVPIGRGRFASARGEEVLFDGPGFTIVSHGGGKSVYEPVSAASGELDLAHYAGIYASDEAEARWIVSARGSRLVLQTGRGVSAPLSPTYRDGFDGPRGIALQFQRDASGRVIGFLLSVDRVRNLIFKRAEPQGDGVGGTSPK